MLNTYLTPEMVRLQIDVKDWEAAVRAAGNLLVDAGYVSPNYIEAMINAVHEMGPYMVLAPGLALAHARPEDGVLKMGISLVTLAKPVNFGSEANDPVNLVIAFGGTDHESHLGLLVTLASFLEDESRRKELASVKTYQELDQLIKAQ
ncbi:MAG: PTS maltose transporter subunit IIBC [Anaerolineaceae bacterium]|nr:PTS maltose transporter subunit IIBC [Anaerolineaceae bacterium]